MPPEDSSTFSPARAPRVAIVGATGAVGEEFLRVLDQRAFPMTSLKLLASVRSAGKTLRFGDQTLTVEALGPHSFEDVDLALFSAGGSISREFAPLAVKAGAVVVDNSSAFRMTDGVPLVVPEVNPAAIAEAGIGLRRGGKEDLKAGIIANPNCSTIIMLMAVHPLHRFAGSRADCGQHLSGRQRRRRRRHARAGAADPRSAGRARRHGRGGHPGGLRPALRLQPLQPQQPRARWAATTKKN